MSSAEKKRIKYNKEYLAAKAHARATHKMLKSMRQYNFSVLPVEDPSEFLECLSNYNHHSYLWLKPVEDYAPFITNLHGYKRRPGQGGNGR